MTGSRECESGALFLLCLVGLAHSHDFFVLSRVKKKKTDSKSSET